MITKLGGTFYDNTYIKEVTVPNTITIISGGRNGGAFNGCLKLQKIILPENLKEIGSSSFKDCSKLDNVIIPDNVTILDDDTFKNCTSLKNITLSKNLATIYGGAFYGCTALEDITIPSKVQDLRKSSGYYNYDGAFEMCTSLKHITLPYSLESIYARTFKEDTELKDITYKGTIEDAKNITLGDTKLGSIDYTTETETTSTKYILGHATWHCTDGDFVPAELATTTTE